MSYVKDINAITETSYHAYTSNTTMTYIAIIVSILLFITIISLGFMWLDERNKNRLAEFEIKMLEHINHLPITNYETKHIHGLGKQVRSLQQTQNITSPDIAS